jgi:hypothetical protein
MADVDKGDAAQAVKGLGEAQARFPVRGPAPVHLWNPPFCGDIGLKIARNGAWFYQGSVITRPALVKLFASILRKDTDRYVLVTPVEMVSVEVEDAPFIAGEMWFEQGESGPVLALRTNVDDEVRVGDAHPLRFEAGPADGLKPYVLVRGGLWALASRPIALALVELGETRDGMFGIESGGAFFPICREGDL